MPQFNWQSPSAEDGREMSQLWHISRTALAGQKDVTSLDRKLWVAQQIAQKHGISINAGYKAVDRARIGDFAL